MPEPKRNGIKADKPHSYRSIEVQAELLRQRLKLNSDEPFDALRFFEETLFSFSVSHEGRYVPVVQAVEDCSSEGMTRWDSRYSRLEVILSERTYQGLLAMSPRAASTVAHELGHAWLHTGQVIRMAGLEIDTRAALHRARQEHRAFEDTEWQANAFASALLMPADGVRKILQRHGDSPFAVARHYRVSLQSAGYRLSTFRRSQ